MAGKLPKGYTIKQDPKTKEWLVYFGRVTKKKKPEHYCISRIEALEMAREHDRRTKRLARALAKLGIRGK